MSKAIRSRKDILSLGANERKRYFWLIKMLAVIPAPPLEQNQSLPGVNYKFITPGYADSSQTYPTNYIQPKCLHDLLISSYTSCSRIKLENDGTLNKFDQTQYFGAYHRHLIILYEYLLTYVDYLLQKKSSD